MKPPKQPMQRGKKRGGRKIRAAYTHTNLFKHVEGNKRFDATEAQVLLMPLDFVCDPTDVLVNYLSQLAHQLGALARDVAPYFYFFFNSTLPWSNDQ